VFYESNDPTNSIKALKVGYSDCKQWQNSNNAAPCHESFHPYAERRISHLLVRDPGATCPLWSRPCRTGHYESPRRGLTCSDNRCQHPSSNDLCQGRRRRGQYVDARPHRLFHIHRGVCRNVRCDRPFSVPCQPASLRSEYVHYRSLQRRDGHACYIYSKPLLIHCTIDDIDTLPGTRKVKGWVRLTSHQTHHMSYRGWTFTGQKTQPTVSKH